MSQREVVEIGVDLELAVLTPQEIEGAYRSLCAAMLLRAAQELSQAQLTKSRIEARHITRAWLFKDWGLITFEEACEACDVDRRWFIDSIVEAADAAPARTRPPRPNRCVFGRRIREPAAMRA